jgi:hypothetical protein
MAKIISLPSGATVTIKDASELKVKDRTRIMTAGDGESESRRGVALGNALLAVIIKEWSYDLLIPSVKEDSIGELPIPDYVALMELTEDYTNKLFPDLVGSAENEADPKAITENSEG